MVIIVDIAGGGGGSVGEVLPILDHTVVLMSKQPIAARAEAVFVGARPRVWGAATRFLGLAFSEPLGTGPLDMSFFATGPAGRLGPLVGMTAGGASDQVWGMGGQDAG